MRGLHFCEVEERLTDVLLTEHRIEPVSVRVGLARRRFAKETLGEIPGPGLQSRKRSGHVHEREIRMSETNLIHGLTVTREQEIDIGSWRNVQIAVLEDGNRRCGLTDLF